MKNRKGLFQYDPGLEDEIKEFQIECYPERDVSQIVPSWRWMFVESAERIGASPTVWGYRRKDGIVAHQGAIPVALKVGESVRRTGWFVETMTAERARGLPIGPMLIQKALEDMPFNISLGQTAYMRELQYKLGWKFVCMLNHYLLVPTFAMDLSNRFPLGSAKIVQRVLGTFHRLKLALAERQSTNTSFRRIDRFDDLHDNLWSNTAARMATCSVVRDASYLNWKYIDRPNNPFSCYELIDEHQDCHGIVVLMMTEPNDVYRYWRGHIVDFVCDVTDPETVIDLVSKASRKLVDQGAANINVLVKQPAVEDSLVKIGFMARGARHQLLVAVPDEDVDQELLLDPDGWFLTMGDSDVDRFS